MNGVPVDNVATAPSASFILEMHRTHGKPKIEQLPFQEGLTVQDVLDSSNTKHRNMEIAIIRKVNNGPRPLRMPVQYDAGKKRVPYEQNYALLANDRLIVRPKHAGPFDSILGQLSGQK